MGQQITTVQDSVAVLNKDFGELAALLESIMDTQTAAPQQDTTPAHDTTLAASVESLKAQFSEWRQLTM